MDICLPVKTLNKYTEDLIINDSTRKMIAEKRLFVTFGKDGANGVPMDSIVGRITDFEFDDDGIKGCIHISNTPMGNVTKGLLETNTNLYVRPVGIGMVNAGVVSEYKLMYFALERE